MSLQFTEFVTPVTFTHFVLWSRGWMKQCDAKLWGCRCPNRITDMSEGFFFSLMGLTSDSMTLLQNLWFLTVSRLFKIQGKNCIAVRWCNTVYSVIFAHRSVIFALLPSKHAPSWSGSGRLRWKRANFIHWNSHNLKLARRQKGQK